MKRFSLLFIDPYATVFGIGQYTGGSDDGFSQASIANQNALPGIYFGGNDDGIGHSSVGKGEKVSCLINKK